MAVKKKILIIDDDLDFINIVKLNLEETGEYEVRAEDIGRFALPSVMIFNPDLIFLDVVLGDVDGSDVASQIRASVWGKDIPIVYVTAIIKKEEENKLTGFLGKFPFLAKPVTTERLLECINKYAKK